MDEIHIGDKVIVTNLGATREDELRRDGVVEGIIDFDYCRVKDTLTGIVRKVHKTFVQVVEEEK